MTLPPCNAGALAPRARLGRTVTTFLYDMAYYFRHNPVFSREIRELAGQVEGLRDIGLWPLRRWQIRFRLINGEAGALGAAEVKTGSAGP